MCLLVSLPSVMSVKFKGDVAWMVESLLRHNEFVLIFFKTMYNTTIIRFGFCDIWNNQGLSVRIISLGLRSRLITLAYLDLDYSAYHKNVILNCLIFHSSIKFAFCKSLALLFK